jgi:hypothetical protein
VPNADLDAAVATYVAGLLKRPQRALIELFTASRAAR